MRTFIAGPADLTDRQAVVLALQKQGHQVFMPLEPSGPESRVSFVRDIAWVASFAEAICVLGGWERSLDARAVLAVGAAQCLRAGPPEDFDAGGPLLTAAEVLNSAGVSAPAPARAPAPVPVRALAVAPAAPAVAISGEVRVTSSTGAEKGSKVARYDLVPAAPLWELACLYGVGSIKYAARNWERGYPLSLSFSALNRHLWSWWNGEDTDLETGVSHLTNVAWHAFTLRQLLQTHPQFDDRPAHLLLAQPNPTLTAPVPVPLDNAA